MNKPALLPLFATDATLTGGPQAGLAPRLAPSAGLLSQGFYQGRRVPARNLSSILGNVGDWVAFGDYFTQHAALSEWSAITIPQVGSDFYFDLVAQRLSRSYGVTQDTQRQIYLFAVDTSGTPANLPRVARTGDGSAADPAPFRLTTIPTFTYATRAQAGAANEIILTNNSTQFAYSSSDAATWTPLSSTYSSNIQAAHYVPGSGAAAGYYALTSGATNNLARSATLSGLATSPSSSTIGTGGFSFSSTQSFADNGSVLLVSGVFSSGGALYRSANGGTSWSLVLTYTGVNSAITWSEFYQKFFAIDDSGALRSSPDGVTWTLIRSDLTSANGFTVAARGIVSCGPALALMTFSGNSAGVVHSLDAGVSWTYRYFATSANSPTLIKSANNRIYAVGAKTLWRSGLLLPPSSGEF